jgi:hypothetical protein
MVWRDEGSPFNSFGSSPGILVSFDRPALSPCLARFKDKGDPKYGEALAIIQSGRDMLARRPAADMPGFVPCAEDRRREAKYAERARIEQRNRDAIRRGSRLYDANPNDLSGEFENSSEAPGPAIEKESL